MQGYMTASDYLKSNDINFIIDPNKPDLYDFRRNMIQLSENKIDSTFFHELNHYYDHQNKGYYELKNYLITVGEVTVLFFPFILMEILIVKQIVLLIPLLFYMGFKFVEEARANISGFLSSQIYNNKYYVRI